LPQTPGKSLRLLHLWPLKANQKHASGGSRPRGVGSAGEERPLPSLAEAWGRYMRIKAPWLRRYAAAGRAKALDPHSAQ